MQCFLKAESVLCIKMGTEIWLHQSQQRIRIEAT